jgi:pimeloyl-ACP methyl ester carboxylesterase
MMTKRTPLRSVGLAAVLCCFLIAFFASVAGISFALAQDVPVAPHFVKKVAGNRTIIVFVHGFFGDGESTWTSGDFYWPKEIASDPTFAGADVLVYAYPTGLWATLSIDELAENLRVFLPPEDAKKYDNVVFLAHSMGGLVVRDYLLKYREIARRTKFIYFYATPTTGSEIDGLIAFALRNNPQLSKMVPMKSDGFSVAIAHTRRNRPSASWLSRWQVRLCSATNP